MRVASGCMMLTGPAAPPVVALGTVGEVVHFGVTRLKREIPQFGS